MSQAGRRKQRLLMLMTSLLWPIKQIAAKQHFISICPQQSGAAINFLLAAALERQAEEVEIGATGGGCVEQGVGEKAGMLSSGWWRRNIRNGPGGCGVSEWLSSKQLLRFIINTVSYEIVPCATPQQQCQ